MAKYKKKPLIVDAEKFLPEDGLFPNGVYFKKGKFYVQTLEGIHIINPGDWLVTGIKGEKYPVQHDIFIESYEEVSDGEQA